MEEDKEKQINIHPEKPQNESKKEDSSTVCLSKECALTTLENSEENRHLLKAKIEKAALRLEQYASESQSKIWSALNEIKPLLGTCLTEIEIVKSKLESFIIDSKQLKITTKFSGIERIDLRMKPETPGHQSQLRLKELRQRNYQSMTFSSSALKRHGMSVDVSKGYSSSKDDKVKEHKIVKDRLKREKEDKLKEMKALREKQKKEKEEKMKEDKALKEKEKKEKEEKAKKEKEEKARKDKEESDRKAAERKEKIESDKIEKERYMRSKKLKAQMRLEALVRSNKGIEIV